MSSESYLAVLKASYDYDPQPDAVDELAIKADQLIFLLERTDDDWWKVKFKVEGEEDGPSGLVPAAYVEPAPHIAVVKALYDYDAAQAGELSVKEDDVLYVYEKDEDWWLVGIGERGNVGYVPGNYCGDGSEGDEAPSTSISASQIVIPDSPPRPAYVDPADRVASNKAQADDIKTWSISEVDKKGKKKKGTLGVGNGAIFFASESDKTPVQKWQTADITSFKIEKSKHVHIEIGGSDSINLHFHAGSKDVGEEIVTKLESSRALSKPQAPSPPALVQPQEPIERPRSSAKSVHFDASEPEIIPAPEQPDEADDDEEPEPQHPPVHDDPVDTSDGHPAIVLYDFAADGEDELSVREGETLIVLEKDSDEWWKVRNSDGLEGVVPASYVELLPGAIGALDRTSHPDDSEDDDAAARAADAAASAAAAAEAEREKAANQAAAEKERKKLEAEKRAKAAAAAAEADRRRREQERERQKEKEKAAAAAVDEDRRRKQEEGSRRKSNGDASSSRGSIDKRGPPSGHVRTWHDRTGQFRVDAAFLGFNSGKLRLHKVNGVVIEVPSEKMSAEDIKYVESMTSKESVKSDDDDEPLEHRRQSLQPKAKEPNRPSPPKKGPAIDWFDFFLSAGCDVDDCTRYAASFERDKIDEAILPDITDSTMRSLGLREGDIIRVQKAIAQRNPVKKEPPSDRARQEQVRRDEDLARQLQAEENSGKRGQAPNLFAGGPNGALKNSVRRGRPQTSKSLPPSTVDLDAITTAGNQIQRGSTPLVSSPVSTPSATSPPPVQPPARTSSAVPAATSGFDDDAWTNRPSSTRPLAPTPPVLAPRAPSAPPAPAPPAPIVAVSPPPPVQTSASAPITQFASSPPTITSAAPQSTGSSLIKTTEADIFDQLARLSQLRVQAPAPPAPSPTSIPAIVSPPPRGFSQGMGMGSSPAPLGQLQVQQTGMYPAPQNGPRGPYAPVPANQSLLQPLVPTTTGFNNFVPTRPQSTPTNLQQQHYQQQPSFLSTQPTGFSGPSPMQPLMSQPTGFSNPGAPLLPQSTGFASAPMLPQATGMMNNNFGGMGMGGMNNIPPVPPLPAGAGFSQIQSNPTGFNSGFGQSPFSNPVPSPPVSQLQNNTNPANIFAAMKSGTFANDDSSAPQGANKYDALRPNPTPLTAQPTGWGYQGMNGMPGGYGYQR